MDFAYLKPVNFNQRQNFCTDQRHFSYLQDDPVPWEVRAGSHVTKFV